MSFITHRRGHLINYSGKFNESMLGQEVTLDEYLELQYPEYLREQFPAQATADRDREWCAILAATVPGDTLWLWRFVDWNDVADGAPYERGGLAAKRDGKVICVWLVWEGR